MPHSAISPRPPAPDLPPRELLRHLSELNVRLASTDLRPCPEVDDAFGHLVRLCTATGDRVTGAVLGDPAAGPLVASLRSLSARGEAELERAWARRIAAAPDPWAELERFPYLDNYRRLVRFELAGLTAAGARAPASATVLGAGPLPLTGLVLARDHGVRVTNVDNDAGACDLADAVYTALAPRPVPRTVRGDAHDPARIAEVAASDTVLLAALVGTDAAAKRRIARALSRAMRPDALLLTRSAHRLRTALYPPVSPDDLTGFTTLLEMHPCDDVVNSVLVSSPRPPRP